MQIHTLASLDKREASDALVIPFFKGSLETVQFDRLKDTCALPISAGDFEGKLSEIAVVWSKDPEEKRIILLGLGEKEKCSLETLRRSFATGARAAQKYKAKSVNVVIPQIEFLPQEASFKAIVEGLFLGSYVFDALKNDTLKEEPTIRLEEVTLICPEIHLAGKVADRVKKVMLAQWQARDLINANADDANPQFLAQVALELAQEFARVSTQVGDKAWIKKERMGLLLAVSRGAATDPTFIQCSYRGHPTSQDHTVLIGKGVTYDTGGLTLKPPDSMEVQKSDMSGAAISLAAVRAAAALGLPINVTAVIPCCENAISASSFKLGDVYESRSGIRVEISNTDAEGRLILADALSYAQDELKPSRLIDIGTLTGSIEIALGNELMGYFSNSETLAEELWQSGQRTFERAWRMPLYEEYKEALKSDIADIKNAATRKGGAILCAIFLQKFIKDIPWAHFDIAGVAFNKEANRYWPKYATGIGLRLLVDYFEHLVHDD